MDKDFLNLDDIKEIKCLDYAGAGLYHDYICNIKFKDKTIITVDVNSESVKRLRKKLCTNKT